MKCLRCCFSLAARYELLHKGLIREEDAGLVPDVYSQNSELESEIIFLKQEADKYKNAAL